MKRFVQEAARTDILGQYRYYLELGAVDVAERFLQSVTEAIESVVAMPDMGAPKILGNPVLKGLRTWPVKGFDEIRIYYLRDSESLIVIRVLHGKRDVTSILEDA